MTNDYFPKIDVKDLFPQLDSKDYFPQIKAGDYFPKINRNIISGFAAERYANLTRTLTTSIVPSNLDRVSTSAVVLASQRMYEQTINNQLMASVEGMKAIQRASLSHLTAGMSGFINSRITINESVQKVIEAQRKLLAVRVAEMTKIAMPTINIPDLSTLIKVPELNNYVHEKVVEEAELIEKELNVEVPYNVFSMEFIFNYLFPAISSVKGAYDLNEGDYINFLFFMIFSFSSVVYSSIKQRDDD